MSEENVEVVRGVRTPVSVPPGTRKRTLDERLLVSFPWLVGAISFIWSLLPPRFGLRRALLSRIVRQGCAAANRRDFDLLFLTLDPEIEYEFGGSPIGGFVLPDLEGVQHGHEGYLEVWEAGIEAFDIKLDYDEVIDFGDRLLLIGRQFGQGRASGIPVDQRIF